MGRTFAFVDESGNHDLDTSKSGSSGFFVICSIIITEKNLSGAYERAEALRLQHFQTGEIKSSKLKAKDSDRRRKILLDLSELPLKLYFTVVDKSRVHKDGGLQFKQSFIKSVNNLLYERLFNHCTDLHRQWMSMEGLSFRLACGSTWRHDTPMIFLGTRLFRARAAIAMS
ncbi:DUF3800 domain-containing protein [Pseudomonas koreensis]